MIRRLLSYALAVVVAAVAFSHVLVSFGWLAVGALVVFVVVMVGMLLDLAGFTPADFR